MKLYNVEDDSIQDVTVSEDTMDALEDVSKRQNRLDKFNQFII
jgi:hypothetical protein